jgi:ABC-2 type transport system permease protein
MRLRLAGIFLRVNALNELQYRANFFVQLFQSADRAGHRLAVIGLVFGHTDSCAAGASPSCWR